MGSQRDAAPLKETTPTLPTPALRMARTLPRGCGEPRFPQTPAHGRRPPTGWGMGNPGFPRPPRTDGALPNPPTGWGMGNPGFPAPFFEGCALTFPRVGVWGTPVSPDPRVRA